MLPRGGSGAPPPPPPPLPQEPAAPQTYEEDDSDDQEFYAGLPDNVAVEEASAKQRALLMSFEMRRSDEAA
jgi:hypothetical protein